MKKTEVSKETLYITQFKNHNGIIWFDRFQFSDLETAKFDFEFAKKSAKQHKLKYKYRLISKETIITEYTEDKDE